jgi:hypothetical protein
VANVFLNDRSSHGRNGAWHRWVLIKTDSRLMKEIILFFVLIWSDDGYYSAESPLKFEEEETCLAFAKDQEKSIRRSFQAFGMPVSFIFSQCGTEQDLKVIKTLFPEGEKT